MAKEIERKYLIDRGLVDSGNMPKADAHSERIQQFYLTMGDSEVRARAKRELGEGHGYQYFLTIKSGTGLVREETEVQITSTTYSELERFAIARIAKTRYKIGRWEIDVFLPPFSNLIIAEIELTHEDEVITIPHWMASYVIREVTDDPQYKNANLARLAESVNRLYK